MEKEQSWLLRGKTKRIKRNALCTSLDIHPWKEILSKLISYSSLIVLLRFQKQLLSPLGSFPNVIIFFNHVFVGSKTKEFYIRITYLTIYPSQLRISQPSSRMLKSTYTRSFPSFMHEPDLEKDYFIFTLTMSNIRSSFGYLRIFETFRTEETFYPRFDCHSDSVKTFR